LASVKLGIENQAAQET